MNDYNLRKKRANIDENGSSFLYGDIVMENALRNLIDWNFLSFARSSERISAMNRELTSRYGPE